MATISSCSNSPPDPLRWNPVCCVLIAGFAGTSAVVLPILMPLWRECGLSLDDMWILQGVFALVLALCQIPTGYLADTLGRRRSMFVGTLLGLVGEGAYLTGDSFTWFLVGEISLGIGCAFVSGADSSLLFETLDAQKRKDSYKLWASYCTAAMFGTCAISSILGSIIGAFSLRLALGVMMMGTVTQLVLMLFIKEPVQLVPVHKMVAPSELGNVFRFCFSRCRTVRWLIVSMSVVGTLAWVAVWFYPLYLDKVGFPLERQGYAFAAFNLVAGISALSARWLSNGKRNVTAALLMFGLAIGFGHLLFGLITAPWGFLFGALHQLWRGAGGVIFGAELHDRTPSAIRATVCSIQGALATLIYAAFSIRLGAANQFLGFQNVLVILGVLTISSVLVLAALRPKKN